MKHIVCFSGGHSSALVAIEVCMKFGKENVILLNHDLNSQREEESIKNFKKQVADYLQIPITFHNINLIEDPDEIPDQFDVCIKADALTSQKGDVLCTSRLKTEPFADYLNRYFPPFDTLFCPKNECVIYYGFDLKETARIQRRTGILGSMGYKTDYPIAFWKDRTIHSTIEIGINPPAHYELFEHANCIGCLKASLLHWYVTFVHYPETYQKGIVMENTLDYTIHTVIRNGIKSRISLTELAGLFVKMKNDNIPATEHQSKIGFANLLRKYHIEESALNKPCECVI